MSGKNLSKEERALVAAVMCKLEADQIDKGDFAEKVGLTQVLITRVLNFQSRLSAGTWKKICKELGLDYEAICTIEETQDTGACDVLKVNVEKTEGVLVNAPAEDLYRLYLFCEERMEDNLRTGTRMKPEELFRLMCALYALRDATLRLQPGEVVEPPQSGRGIAR